MLVADIYKKSAALIHQTRTIKEAVKEMLENHFNSLIVVDNKGELVGVLSMQDIAVFIVPPEIQLHPSLARSTVRPEFFEEICREAGNQRVSTVMRTDYMSVDLETPVVEIAADFIEHDLYIVAVLNEDKIVGVVTRTEIKKAIARNMNIAIKS